VAYHKTDVSISRNEARYEAFLGSARKLWLTRNLAAVTMAKVASEAKSSVGNLYFHVGSREALIARTLERELFPINVAIEHTMRRKGRIHTRLAQACLEIVRIFAASPELRKLCLAEPLPLEAEAVFSALLVGRLHTFFQLRPPKHYQPDFAERAWVASFSAALHTIDQRNRIPEQVAAELIRWNFLALGFGKPTVARVLERIGA